MPRQFRTYTPRGSSGMPMKRSTIPQLPMHRRPIGDHTPWTLAISAIIALAVLACTHLRDGCGETPTPEPNPPETHACAQNPGPAELTLATWNIAWLANAENRGRIPRTREDLDRLVSYLDAIDADIYVLQEIEGAAAAALVFDPALYEMAFVDEDLTQQVGVVWRRDLPVSVHGAYEALGVGETRAGVDFSVCLGDQEIRMLGVHLKSGCFNDSFRSRNPDACRVQDLQTPTIRAWMDARAAEETAFVLLGDFNRRFNATDRVWQELNTDHTLSLSSEGLTQQCWNSRYRDYIDHFVLDARATRWWIADSFREQTYLEEHAEHERELSDHCPMTITLRR